MDMNMFTTIMCHYLCYYDDQKKHVRELAQVALDETDTESDAVSLLACWLEDEYMQTAPKISGYFGELFKAALDLIYFEQIAQRFIDESWGGRQHEHV